MNNKNLNGEKGSVGGFEKSPEQLLAEEVLADFKNRQAQRRSLEKNWQLCMNFLCGNQYCDLNAMGEIFEENNQFYWQTKRVFNYIAPTVDTRCAKLSRIRPSLAVRAASGEEADINSAKLAQSILNSVSDECDLDGVITDATVWSESCGTAFYKVVWDGYSGATVGVTENGVNVKEGNVKVVALSPFEIYPYSLAVEKMSEQPSVIHAKALPVQDIYEAYGVELVGRSIDEFSLAPYSIAAHGKGGEPYTVKAVKHGYELVIERYIRPNSQFPNGRLTIVAGGALLFDGEMPYINGDGGQRTYPFIKQTCLPLAGSFFGGSVVDRLIPVQRAYNAVKNRKHEFLNRVCMGTLAVEDGSVDTDDLVEDGITPGKIIVYRQGGKAPEMLTLGDIPEEFSKEEESLQEEFAKISGTGELSRGRTGLAGITSATGLQLLIEQDDARLNNSYQSIKSALKGIGKHVLRLYRQFASDTRLIKCAGENGSLKLLYFKGSDITSDDVVVESDSDINMTPAQRRTVIYELLDRGLFSDENGKLNASAKEKILRLLGYSGFGGERDLHALHKNRAAEENSILKTDGVEVKEYDDHAAHITEHTAFLLTEKLDKIAETRVCAHVNEHKKKLSEVK
ncbi:MAG: hypothetical protein J6B04_02425 [Clostridia bacterium]|nr:hypothetical protein [Clostridia bacterium]